MSVFAPQIPGLVGSASVPDSMDLTHTLILQDESLDVMIVIKECTRLDPRFAFEFKELLIHESIDYVCPRSTDELIFF